MTAVPSPPDFEAFSSEPESTVLEDFGRGLTQHDEFLARVFSGPRIARTLGWVIRLTVTVLIILPGALVIIFGVIRGFPRSPSGAAIGALAGILLVITLSYAAHTLLKRVVRSQLAPTPRIQTGVAESTHGHSTADGKVSANRLLGWWRLREFALDNNLDFTPLTHNPYYPGILFSSGSNRKSIARVHNRCGQPHFDLGTVLFSLQTPAGAIDHEWRYLAVQVDARRPRLVIESRPRTDHPVGQTTLQLPRSTSAENLQPLALESQFEPLFTVFTSQSDLGHSDAVAPTELLGRLERIAQPISLEFIDDLVLIYLPQSPSLTDETALRSLFAALDAVK